MQKNPRFLILPFCFFLLTTALPAQSPADRLQQANEAYAAENYGEAIGSYEQLLADGFRSEALLYNLGNAYYRQGDMGKAALNYERALLLDPGDEDARHNLEVIRGQFPEELEAAPGFFLTRWWRGLHQAATPGTWAAIGIALLWLGTGGLIAWLLAPRRKTRKRGFFAGLSLLFLSVLPFALGAAQQAYQSDTGLAVVLEEQTVLRSGADRQSTEITVLPAGARIELLDQIGEWHKVRLQNREQGWLPGGAFGRVR